MQISIFDIFKIGIGPSSSHTIGPWKAIQRCLSSYATHNPLDLIDGIQVELYGSLAKTGKGHGTEMAVLLALSGYDAVTIQVDEIDDIVRRIRETRSIDLMGKQPLAFDPGTDIRYNPDWQPAFHPNALRISIHQKSGNILEKIYYSIGGGFVVAENEPEISDRPDFPYPIQNAGDLLRWCSESHKCISEVVLANELAWNDKEEIEKQLAGIWSTMKESIFAGCHTQGILPGGLNVHRRASFQNMKLITDYPYTSIEEWMALIRKADHSFTETLNWVSCFALAVNEENAAFGKVVTAPTNGAAGVIPAVLMYYYCFFDDVPEESFIKFLLVAGELGSIFKKGATISAAMGGCQAEIGVSSAMAAGALTELLGGSPEKVLMAAEIAMEHHLGLTCDPVGGLVQIPCIERNAMGAMKAITASQIALASDHHFAKVSLDNVIKTMWDTAEDMNSKYKETAEGGLAINIPVSMPDC